MHSCLAGLTRRCFRICPHLRPPGLGGARVHRSLEGPLQRALVLAQLGPGLFFSPSLHRDGFVGISLAHREPGFGSPLVTDRKVVGSTCLTKLASPERRCHAGPQSPAVFHRGKISLGLTGMPRRSVQRDDRLHGLDPGRPDCVRGQRQRRLSRLLPLHQALPGLGRPCDVVLGLLLGRPPFCRGCLRVPCGGTRTSSRLLSRVPRFLPALRRRRFLASRPVSDGLRGQRGSRRHRRFGLQLRDRGIGLSRQLLGALSGDGRSLLVVLSHANGLRRGLRVVRGGQVVGQRLLPGLTFRYSRLPHACPGPVRLPDLPAELTRHVVRCEHAQFGGHALVIPGQPQRGNAVHMADSAQYLIDRHVHGSE